MPNSFPWYGLPSKAAVSRWWGLFGLVPVLGISGLLYFLTNEIAAARGVTVFDPAQLFAFNGLTLDEAIPYLPWTVLFYEPLYIGFFLMVVLSYPKTSLGARQLFQLYYGFIFISLAASVFFILCPAEMTLRADADFDSNTPLLHQMVLAIYKVDRPFNTWPSLHVAFATVIAITVAGWVRRSGRTVIIVAAWAALVASTLTLKQHYIWDAVTGSLLALAYWWFMLRGRNPANSL